ncbi:MAG: hypothetical protein U0V73_13400 [Acidimicrobiia bacterium]
MDEVPELLDLHEVEQELCRLPDISAARIVADHTGRPTEIHVLANPGKPAKQVVRDIQSVALASFGLEIDRRIVSVVQLGAVNGNEGRMLAVTTEPAPFRPVITGINAEVTGLRTVVRVALAHGGEEAAGYAEGSIATASRHRLVATAALDALRQLDPSAECLDVEGAQLLRIGAHDVAVVTVVYVIPPTEQIVSGSALVRQNQEADAVARAVLDATNRRLPRLA